MRRTGSDKDVDATGRELWVFEAVPHSAGIHRRGPGGAASLPGEAASQQRGEFAAWLRLRVRHVSSAQYLARGPDGRAQLVARPVGDRCDFALERVSRDRGDDDPAGADASFVLRHAASGDVFGERAKRARRAEAASSSDSDSESSDSDSSDDANAGAARAAAPNKAGAFPDDGGGGDDDDDDDAAAAALGFHGGAPTQNDAFQVGAVSWRRGVDSRVARELRREFVDYGRRVRDAPVRCDRAERALGACIGWLLGKDAGETPLSPSQAAALGGTPDRGRQALAREMGLIAALADVVRAPCDREARALGGDRLRHYLASHRLPKEARDLTAIIGPGMIAHRLAMRALQLAYTYNRENEFFFVEQEDGAWFLACIDQISYSVGAAEALSQLVSDNEELLEMHIDARVCDDFCSLIEAQGPRAELLQFLGAVCSCRGRGVKSNQELCAYRLGLVETPGRGESTANEAKRGALLIKCRQGGDGGLPRGPAVDWVPGHMARAPPRFLGDAELREGFAAAFVSWTSPPDDEAWELRTGHLFWGPAARGVRVVDGGAVAPGLPVVRDGRGTRWVELSHLLWILEEDPEARDALCRAVVGCGADAVYAAARESPAVRAAVSRQKQLARYFVEQVLTLSEMVRTRSYKVARVLEKEWTYGLLVSSLVNPRLPTAAREAQGRKRVRKSQLQRLLSRSFSTRFG